MKKTRATNELFAVQGQASGGAGVTNVYYALNNSSWISATTANQWSNWEAQVTLTPGTNTVAAYAVDGSGVHSKTNTVRFIYVVLSQLTVHSDANVILKPNYDGALLQIGTTYTMKAKGRIPGFGVQNWTDATSTLLGAGAKLTFTMTSNLVITANYGETKRPVVTVVSAFTNADGVANQLFLRGTASDNVGVTGVFYQLNLGAWQPVTLTTNNWTNWVVQLDNLLPGINSFNVYALDAGSNVSYTVPIQINNSTSPKAIAGSLATSDVNGSSPFALAFGTKTFSQSSADTNYFAGVGSYTFSRSSYTAVLKLKYTGPPSVAASGGSQTLNLYFYDAHKAYFSNPKNNLSGYLYFSNAPAFAPTSLTNQVMFTADGNGKAEKLSFNNGSFAAQSLGDGQTDTGSYAYTVYSPVGVLLKMNSTNGTRYLAATYAETNYGSFYSEAAADTNSQVFGRFMLPSQITGGNAPTTLSNQVLQVFAGPESFNLTFGDTTYSEDTVSTNYDNAVGTFDYSLLDTNTGHLHLAVVAPPTIAGSQSSANLMFVSGTTGLLTNEDNTFSAFVMSSATNFIGTTITNTTLVITESDTGAQDDIYFTDETNFNFGGDSVGTYTYTNYGPATAMIPLNVTDTNYTVGEYWVQLNLKSSANGTNYGSVFVTILTNSVLKESFSGTYQSH